MRFPISLPLCLSFIVSDIWGFIGRKYVFRPFYPHHFLQPSQGTFPCNLGCEVWSEKKTKNPWAIYTRRWNYMIQAFSHCLCQYWLVTDQTDRQTRSPCGAPGQNRLWGWVIIIHGNDQPGPWQPIQADWRPESVGLVWGSAAAWRRTTYIHQMNRVNCRNRIIYSLVYGRNGSAMTTAP